MCTPSSASAASNNTGICQVHSATACKVQAPIGALQARQATRSKSIRATPASALRQDAFNAHVHASKGRERTSSGAATTISSSCCTMCTEKSRVASVSIGESSAAQSTSQPTAKRAAWPNVMPRPRPARRHKRLAPSA